MGLRNGPAACDVLFETGRCSQRLFQRTTKRYETCGGKRGSVVSTRQKLLPQAIESISRSRTPPILSRAQARFAMVRGSSGKAQLAGFAKAHRCHRGGRGDCAADSQAFRRRSKRESRERERRKVRKCSTWRHYKKPSSDTVIEGLIRGR